MAKGGGICADQNGVRRAQKQKQKAAVRKGKVQAGPTFSFADLKADAKAKQEAQKARQKAFRFGQDVDATLHQWLDAADAAGAVGIVITHDLPVTRQAVCELAPWAAWHGGYLFQGINEFTSRLVKAVKKVA